MNHTQPSAAETDKQERRENEEKEAVSGPAADGTGAGQAGAAGQPEHEGDGGREDAVPEGAEPAEAASGEEGAAAERPAASEAAETSEAAEANEAADRYRREAEELQQRLLRLQADYDNFRRRTRLEKEAFAKYASQQLMEKLLPVLDNFERALAAGESAADVASFVKGVDMIFRQLTDVLAQEGLEPIQAAGEPFDPELHQAVMRVESEEHGDNVVVEELQKGYKLKDKVIRPSMVKVNARP